MIDNLTKPEIDILLALVHQIAADDVVCWTTSGSLSSTPVLKIENDPSTEETVRSLVKKGGIELHSIVGDSEGYLGAISLTPKGFFQVMGWWFLRAFRNLEVHLKEDSKLRDALQEIQDRMGEGPVSQTSLLELFRLGTGDWKPAVPKI